MNVHPRGGATPAAGRLVYTSTVGTIGVADDGRLASEESLVHFEHLFGHYKRSKYLAEHEVLRAGAAGLPVVLVHPTFPVGEGDTAPTPTGRTIVEFLNGRIPAYVDTALNVVHVDDVARGHVLAAQRGALGPQLHPRRREHVAAARCSRRSPTSAGSPAPRVRLSPRVGAADRAQRRVGPGDGAAPRADAAVGAGAHGDDAHGVRRPAARAPSSATRACRPATRCAARRRGTSTTASSSRRSVERIRRAGKLGAEIDLRDDAPTHRRPRGAADRARPDGCGRSPTPPVDRRRPAPALRRAARCSPRAAHEAFALHERYINPQMPRVLRTIGFDADYVRAEGAYLFDRDGRRYLDFLAGFGVFALGRCHPGIEQALRDAMDCALPNLVQMECPPLSGPARRGARRAHAERRLPLLLHEQRRGVGRDRASSTRAARPAAVASCSPTTRSTGSRRARCR